MSDEKKYTAKEAAIAVLKKAEELLKKSDLAKASVAPASVQKSEEIPQKASQEADVTPPDKIREQPAPENNPAEQKEGNNPEWGTAPGIKGHIKLAKFCGHMQSKRKASKPAPGAPNV